jgi:hypothetical protein
MRVDNFPSPHAHSQSGELLVWLSAGSGHRDRWHLSWSSLDAAAITTATGDHIPIGARRLSPSPPAGLVPPKILEQRLVQRPGAGNCSKNGGRRHRPEGGIHQRFSGFQVVDCSKNSSFTNSLLRLVTASADCNINQCWKRSARSKSRQTDYSGTGTRELPNLNATHITSGIDGMAIRIDRVVVRSTGSTVFRWPPFIEQWSSGALA